MSEYQVHNLPHLVSIIITNYNQGRFFKDAFESAINQTYQNKEIIIVDDGSTDNSLDIIQNVLSEYKGNVLYKLITKNNGGTASARNAGIKNCQGQFLAFLDTDDIYYPDKVAVSVGKLLEYNGAIGVAYSDYDVLYEKTGNKKREIKAPFDADLLLQFCLVSTNSIVHRLVFEKIGLFDETIRGMEDYEFWLRASTQFAFCHIPFALFCYREHGDNKSLTTDRSKWTEEENKMKERFMAKYLRNQNV